MRKKCKRCKMPEVQFTVVLKKKDGETEQLDPVYVPWYLAAQFYREAKRKNVPIHKLVEDKLWLTCKFFDSRIPDWVIALFTVLASFTITLVIVRLIA